MTTNKITPALWYHSEGGKLEHVTNYYKDIFNDDFVVENIVSLGETPGGYSEMGNVKLFGNSYLFMSTANEHNKFNDTFAIMLNCKDQEEIDKFWNYFTKDGSESMCGWCIDKFGLRWQVIPENLNELMSLPNSWEIMMKQKKIIISEYK